jgi:hypothetical protein
MTSIFFSLKLSDLRLHKLVPWIRDHYLDATIMSQSYNVNFHVTAVTIYNTPCSLARFKPKVFSSALLKHSSLLQRQHFVYVFVNAAFVHM